MELNQLERDIIDIKTSSERVEEQRKAQEAYDKMTFADNLQLPNRKQQLKRVEEGQREAFEAMIQRDAPHLNKEWKDMFALFFTLFLKNEIKSMLEFMFIKANAPVEKRELKPEWLEVKE